MLEKTTSLVQTELVKQLCSSFYLVWVELHWEGLEGKSMKSQNIKSLIQGCLKIIFLKPQNKNNDLAR